LQPQARRGRRDPLSGTERGPRWRHCRKEIGTMLVILQNNQHGPRLSIPYYFFVKYTIALEMRQSTKT
jgi:hypothetical protein